MADTNLWGTAIRRRMTEWNWNQTSMARFLDVPLSTLNGWLKGYRTPSDHAKEMLVGRLHIHGSEVAPDWLRSAVVPSLPPAPTRENEAA
jgi:DNA-binding transcriptional regulator YiaG